MIAYHGKSGIKEEYLARVRAHRAADEIVKGRYWQQGKGCAVGCTIHSSSHSAYETELGIPSQLAHLEDVTFERLKNGASMLWPERFLEAIPVGADLSFVWPGYAVWLLGDEKHGVLQFAKNDQTKQAIRGVLALYEEWVSTGVKPDAERFEAVRYAASAEAYAAAEEAARRGAAAAAYVAAAAASAYASAAAYAAYAADAAYVAAAFAYASAAAYAAYAADAAYADAAYAEVAYAEAAAADAEARIVQAADARAKLWTASSEKLLELLRQAPVRGV